MGINSVTVSPDGSLAASGGQDGKAFLWDLGENSNNPLHQLDGGEEVTPSSSAPTGTGSAPPPAPASRSGTSSTRNPSRSSRCPTSPTAPTSPPSSPSASRSPGPPTARPSTPATPTTRSGSGSSSRPKPVANELKKNKKQTKNGFLVPRRTAGNSKKNFGRDVIENGIKSQRS